MIDTSKNILVLSCSIYLNSRLILAMHKCYQKYRKLTRAFPCNTRVLYLVFRRKQIFVPPCLTIPSELATSSTSRRRRGTSAPSRTYESRSVMPWILEIGQQQIHDGAAVNGSPHGCAEAGDHDGGDDVVLGGAPCSCAGTGLVTPILRSHGYVGTPTRRQRRTICLI